MKANELSRRLRKILQKQQKNLMVTDGNFTSNGWTSVDSWIMTKEGARLVNPIVTQQP